jgi:N,N'-diacetyllegionaminate synthase
MRTLIIAEAGVNHNGDLGMARALVHAAADAGADLVKFQTFKADRLLTASAVKADYQLQATPVGETQFEMLRRLELSDAMHLDLQACCDSRGIGFFSTAFDAENLAFLMQLGMNRIKIPSGEITNLPYLRKAGAYGKPILLSTGMSTLGEIEAAINVLEKAGTARNNITVLHCNTEYPVPIDEVNLRAMLSIRAAFDVAVGFSDHTEGCEAAIAAVALGATVIEKHFTLDRNLPGPDHRASLEPDKLASLVLSIRNIEKALGDGIKRPGPSELKNIAVARRSLVATRFIAKGELFSDTNLEAKRPGTGISPMRQDELVGKPAHRDFRPDELID